MTSLDGGAAHDREMLNIPDKPSITSAFDVNYIREMFTETNRVNGGTIDQPYFFIALDPSAGHDRNIYALSSAAFFRDPAAPGEHRCMVCLFLFARALSLFYSRVHRPTYVYGDYYCYYYACGRAAGVRDMGGA